MKHKQELTTQIQNNLVNTALVDVDVKLHAIVVALKVNLAVAINRIRIDFNKRLSEKLFEFTDNLHIK